MHNLQGIRDGCGEWALMLTDAEQWERMEPVECEVGRGSIRQGVVLVTSLLVTSGRARDWVPRFCPECGMLADEVRMLRGGDGRRWYYTMHGGELHEVAVCGRARKRRRDKETR